MGAFMSQLTAYVQWPKWRDTRFQRIIAVSAKEPWMFQYAFQLVREILKGDQYGLKPEEFREDHKEDYLVHVYCSTFGTNTQWLAMMKELNHQRIRDPSLPWIFLVLCKADFQIPAPPRRLLEWAYSRDPSVYNIPMVIRIRDVSVHETRNVAAELQLSTWIYELYTLGHLEFPAPRLDDPGQDE